ncbi:MAG: 3-hydroxyacyl-CoA dehydrogenase [Zoogloeaceae bacterium]|nr:3-hydroxyacyl-CoA dehydrogenase [Zoogloeaceae bacterium]MCK6385668.1 3-hydroxyacyl-CoA dehydrogenase [Rhodocyclaceae bacterium]
MHIDIHSPALTLGVAGAGAMGRGIAQIAAQAGLRVLLFDLAPGAAASARDAVSATLAGLAAKGKLPAADAEAAATRIAPVASLEAFASCQVVVEAVIERLEAKRELFRKLEDIVDADCILASNTSSLSITEIAAACRRPGRVAGFHFFNPVPLMKVVEVVDALLTEPRAVEALVALARRMGHVPVRAKDTPGFIVNHAGRGYVTEALRLAGENVAEFHVIDAILRGAGGFRMGPFELLDLTGLDVSHPVMEAIYRQYYQEPRYRPSALAAQRLAGGLLGRKSGRGFYEYADGKQQMPPQADMPQARPERIWVSNARPKLAAAVRELVQRLGGTLDESQSPQDGALIVVTPLGEDASSCAAREGLDAARTVAIDALPGLDRHRTLMATPLTADGVREAALGLFSADGVPASLVRDSAGCVVQRVLAHIVNIGCDIAQQGIAQPADIDSAVTLGLGYPKGPLALGDALGARTVLDILENLQACSGDPRYRPSPWLRRRALLGASLLTPETR